MSAAAPAPPPAAASAAQAPLAGCDVHTRRVQNGYGSTTSVFSPSNIGLYDAASVKRQQQAASFARRFESDADYQLKEYRKSHPFKKLLHLQKCYPETVKKLDGAMAVKKVPAHILEQQRDAQQRGPDEAAAAGAQERRAGAAKEYQFVHSKMEYVRHKGKDAAVHKIITGQCPRPQHVPLFPVGATHQQLLGIMRHNPGHPEAPAPPVPRPRRWLGDAVGWES